MFVLSLKTSKRKLMILAAVILVAVLGCFLLFGRGGNESYAVSAMGKYQVSAKDNSARVEFLSQFGWTVNEEPVEICEIIIPSQFNETYQKYNEIQKQQGLDLSKYSGKTCKRWTYDVTNYPDQPQGVHANLLILDGRVIGGDICSVALNGFMHGFSSPTGDSVQNTAAAASSSEPNFDKVEKSTERATLAPDPNMPNAPTD